MTEPDPIYYDSAYLARQAGNYPVECPDCGWTGLENERLFYCPGCGGANVEDVDLPPSWQPETYCELEPDCTTRSESRAQAWPLRQPQGRLYVAPLALGVAAVIAVVWVSGRKGKR